MIHTQLLRSKELHLMPLEMNRLETGRQLRQIYDQAPKQNSNCCLIDTNTPNLKGKPPLMNDETLTYIRLFLDQRTLLNLLMICFILLHFNYIKIIKQIGKSTFFKFIFSPLPVPCLFFVVLV